MAVRLNSLILPLCAIIVSANSSRQLDSDFHVCAPWRKYPITIKNVVIELEPVVSGELVTFTVPAYSSHELQGGTLIAIVSLYGFKVHSKRDDLCSKTQFPVKGNFSLTSAKELPPFTPHGPYKVKFQLLDPNGVEQARATLGFNTVWRFLSSSASRQVGKSTAGILGA